ncbi:hypothetical protein ABID21_004803, partial [Pseudorhizobium tarimense]
MTNEGPNPGSGYSGRLALFTGGSDTILVEDATGNTPIDSPQILSITQDVSAADLAAGDVVVGLWLETFHAGTKSWTADQFQADYEYDTTGCTPDLTIEKTGTLNDLDGDGLIDLGETISYSFLVENTGAVTLTGVTVNDPLLTGAGVALDQGPQTLAPGATFTFTATYTPDQDDIDAGSVTNTATGTGTPPTGPSITSPPDEVTVPPDTTSGLTIEKTGTLNDLDGDGLIDLGETISYSFLVENTGAVTLTGVTVNDPLL